ncbi:hypothetical protein [uncultured Algibacter sp.]|uniref:hypothetical protein n=1 Tax=uncultured Algibacter sp. TaxID=298659 RepID=UPI0032164CE4
MDQPKKSKSKGKLSYAEQREGLKKQYGARKVFRWLGYADGNNEKALVDYINTIAIGLNIPPSYFYTIAIGEGLGKKHLDLDTSFDAKGNLRTDQTMSGLSHFGLDDFGDDFSRVKKYLPNDYNSGDEFDTVVGSRPNDFGRKTVNTAIFKDLESGLEGFGAILKHRRDLFLSHAKAFNYPAPNADQIAFWNYCYFQGEGRAKRYLHDNKGLDYNNAAPANMKEVKQLALERLATWRYVQMNKLFD